MNDTVVQEITWMSAKAGFHFDLIALLGISLSEIKINPTSLKHVRLRSCRDLSICFNSTILFTCSKPTQLLQQVLKLTQKFLVKIF